MIVAIGRRSEREPESLLPLPVLYGERAGVRGAPTQILRMLMSTASPLTRSQEARDLAPQRAGRGERSYPALESWPGAGIVTIGGLALRPSTWKPATRL